MGSRTGIIRLDAASSMVAAPLPVRKRKRWLACSGLAFMFLVTAGFFLVDCNRAENWPPERVTFSGREYASNGSMVSPDEVKRVVMIGPTSESQLQVFV